MQNLNEAVIKLINEDVINGKKLIENELYNRLGVMLEEKLKEYAPGIFSEGKMASKDYDKDGEVESSSEEWKGSRDKAIKKAKGEESSESEESEEYMEESTEDQDIISEEFELLASELESLVEEIEAETGEELTEQEIEEIADILPDQ